MGKIRVMGTGGACFEVDSNDRVVRDQIRSGDLVKLSAGQAKAKKEKRPGGRFEMEYVRLEGDADLRSIMRGETEVEESDEE